jgi:hypothetical protein
MLLITLTMLTQSEYVMSALECCQKDIRETRCRHFEYRNKSFFISEVTSPLPKATECLKAAGVREIWCHHA